MKTEYVSFYDCGQRQVIEQAREVLPNVGVSIFSEALIIKSIYLSDLLAFVVSSEDSDSAWISDLKADKE